MHRPPAASVAVRRSHWHLGLLVVASLASAFACWLSFGAESQAWLPLLPLLWWLTTAWALLAWWHSPAGRLLWDGEHWFWQQESGLIDVQVELVLDLQRCVLVRLQGPAMPVLWLWLAQDGPAALNNVGTVGDVMQDARWWALRRALVFSTGRGASDHLHAAEVSEK